MIYAKILGKRILTSKFKKGNISCTIWELIMSRELWPIAEWKWLGTQHLLLSTNNKVKVSIKLGKEVFKNRMSSFLKNLTPMELMIIRAKTIKTMLTIQWVIQVH